MRAIFAILIAISSLSVNAWEVRDHHKRGTNYNLLLRSGEIADLDSALSQEKRILSGINLGRVIELQSDSLQTEIQSYLNRHHPNELSAALSSASDMHNPRIKLLRKPFEEALLDSTYVQSIADVLREYGYEIEGVSTEKFMLVEHKYFDAIAWLKVKQLTSKASRTPQTAPLL